VELSAWMPEKLMHSFIQVQNLGTIIELFIGYLKGIWFGHFTPPFLHLPKLHAILEGKGPSLGI
jgi:hypothetical protein